VSSPTAATTVSGNLALSEDPTGIVAALLDEAIAEGTLSGGVVLASQGGRPFVSLAVGTKAPLPEGQEAGASDAVSTETVFDLGAMTQSICTTTLMLRFASSGKISVTDRASRYLQALGVGQKSTMTLAHLLTHTAGFPTGVSVYEELVRANRGPRPGILASSGARQYAYTHFHNLPLKFEPGSKELRSDANFIVLGEICEIISGLPLEKAYSRYVAAPLRLSSLNFIDLTLLRRKGLEPVLDLFAASGECSRRGRVIAGEVWDENAWVMGGVSGHNGLFGNARDVHTWAREIVKGLHGQSEIFTAEATRKFAQPEALGGSLEHRVGFDAPSREDGFVDFKVAPRAFVSAGATGSSVFVDPDRDVVVVFLSNAGFSGHASRRFAALRSDIHAAVLGL